MKAVRDRLVAELDAMCAETHVAVEQSRPDLVRRLPAGVVDAAIRSTHQRAIELLGGAETRELRAEAVNFGRQAAHLGVGPEDVMAGYRLGAEVANRRVRSVLLERDAPAATVLALWSWSTSFFDELADRTVEGVQREAVAQHGRRARARQALADALLGGEPPAATADAAWVVPDEVVVVVARAGDLEPAPEDAIVARRDGALVAIAPAGRPWPITPGVLVAVGPALPAARAPESWQSARHLAELAGGSCGRLADVPVVHAADFVLDLTLAGDPWARRTLPEQALAPLHAAAGRSRPLLEETLRAWLQTPGRPQAIAQALHLHPQTVQYRLRRLRSCFGEQLDDPGARLALSVALRLTEGPARP